MFPDLNQILKHLNGKLNLFSMIRFLYLKKKKTMTRQRASFGCDPSVSGAWNRVSHDASCTESTK
jgi:hypothetical protein